MPLTGIRGKGGSGKNTYFAYHVFKNDKLKNDIKKYVNFDFEAPKVKKFNTIELLELEETEELTICALDEAYVEMDCRNSMDLLNKLNSYLLFQARKNNMSMVAISQLNVLDLRWRELEEKTIYCFDRPILDKNLKSFKGDFHYALCEPFKKPVRFTLKYHTAKKVFRFFKTKQKIMPHDIEELKMRLNMRNPKTKKEVVNKIVNEILGNYTDLDKKTLSHIWLKNALLDLEILEMSLEPYVYIRLMAKLLES